MVAKLVEGIVLLVLGVYPILVATGVINPSKNRQAGEAFVKKWRWTFILTGVSLLALGAMNLAELYW